MAPAASACAGAPGSHPATVIFVCLFLIIYCPGKDWGPRCCGAAGGRYWRWMEGFCSHWPWRTWNQVAGSWGWWSVRECRFKISRTRLVEETPVCPRKGGAFFCGAQPAPPPLLEITGSEISGAPKPKRCMKKGTLCGQEQGPPDQEIGQPLGSWTHPKISKCWGNGERSFEGWIRGRAGETWSGCGIGDSPPHLPPGYL